MFDERKKNKRRKGKKKDLDYFKNKKLRKTTFEIKTNRKK